MKLLTKLYFEKDLPKTTKAPIIILLLTKTIKNVSDAIIWIKKVFSSSGFYNLEDQNTDVKFKGKAWPLATIAPNIISILPILLRK